MLSYTRSLRRHKISVVNSEMCLKMLTLGVLLSFFYLHELCEFSIQSQLDEISPQLKIPPTASAFLLGPSTLF